MYAATTAPSRTTLIFMTAVSVLTLNLFLPSLPAMAREFEVSYGTMSLSIAGYLVLSSIVILVLGPVADRFGRRPVLLVSFTVFTLASVGSALTHSSWLFLIFRCLQALVATGMSLSRAIVRDIFPTGQAASVLAYIAMAMAVAPMLGPLVGGVLQETFGWHSVFWAFAICGAICTILIWRDLGETAPGKGMTAAEQIEGYREVLRSKRFWGYCGVIAFSVGGFFVFLAGAPFVLERSFGLPPSQVGLAIGVTAVGFFVGSAVAGRSASKSNPISLMRWGRWIGVLAPVSALVLWGMGITSPWAVFACLTLVGVANGVALPSANTGAMSVRAKLAASASGLAGAIANLVGAGLTILTGALLSEGTAVWSFLTLILLTSLAALGSVYWTARAEAVKP